MGNQFVAYENVIPLLAPQDITNADTASPYIDLKYAQRVHFMVGFGAITTGTAADSVCVSVECATATTGTEAEVAFKYRKSGVLTANTWGAITSAAATGLVLTSTEDNVSVFIELDPDALAASDYRFARVKIATPDDMGNLLVYAAAMTEPRYVQTTHLSATAAAS